MTYYFFSKFFLCILFSIKRDKTAQILQRSKEFNII